MAVGAILLLLGIWLIVRTVAGNPSLPSIILGLGKAKTS